MPSYNVCLVPTVLHLLCALALLHCVFLKCKCKVQCVPCANSPALSECPSHGELQPSVWFPPSANTQSGRWESRKADRRIEGGLRIECASGFNQGWSESLFEDSMGSSQWLGANSNPRFSD